MHKIFSVDDHIIEPAQWSPPADWSYHAMGHSDDVGSLGTGAGCRTMITTGNLIEECGADVVDGVCERGHRA